MFVERMDEWTLEWPNEPQCLEVTLWELHISLLRRHFLCFSWASWFIIYITGNFVWCWITISRLKRKIFEVSLVPEYNHKTMAFTFFNLGREGGNKSSNPESINLAEILAFLPNMKWSRCGDRGMGREYVSTFAIYEWLGPGLSHLLRRHIDNRQEILSWNSLADSLPVKLWIYSESKWSVKTTSQTSFA